MKISKGERSKSLMMDVAISLFAQKGFDKTSFQNIADLTQASQSAVLYHFKNKTVLLEECIKVVVETNYEIVNPMIESVDTPFDKLTQFVLGNLEWSARYQEHSQLVLLLFYSACNNKKMNAMKLRLREGGHTRVKEYVDQLCDNKNDHFSLSIHDFITGTIFQLISEPFVQANLSRYKLNANLFLNSMFNR